VLGQLNDIITDGPYRFRVHAPFDQTAFVIACTEDERQRLEARGWRFAGSESGQARSGPSGARPNTSVTLADAILPR
jgi:hypothetical protein